VSRLVTDGLSEVIIAFGKRAFIGVCVVSASTILGLAGSLLVWFLVGVAVFDLVERYMNGGGVQ